MSIDEEALFLSLANRLEIARLRAEQNRQNYLFDEMTYYAQYMEMRTMQYHEYATNAWKSSHDT